MNQVVAIAINTFKETIRDRVLAVIVVFALLMIAGGLWLGSISLGEQGRMMKDFGLVAVTGFGLIVAVFVAAGLVHKEVEKRTVFVLFSKPVSRAAFITGKFMGLCGTMAVVLAGMGLFLFALVWMVAGRASGMVLLAVRDDLRPAAAIDGGDDLLLDAGLRRSWPRCSASACSSPGSSATTCWR